MLSLLGLSPVISIGLAMLVLLGAAIILRAVFDLVAEVKRLTTGLKRANDRLQDAAIEVRVGAEEASERFGKLGGRRQERGGRARNP